jgi:hypothetical protein
MENTTDNESEFFIIEDGKQVKLEIPLNGMLGLLAYGDLGVQSWRKVRQAEFDKKAAEKDQKTIEKEGNT